MTKDPILKYDYIDALRGFAILAVVFLHSSIYLVSPTSKVLSGIATEGARGVQLFYIASALTLFLSIESRKDFEERPLTKFYIRRFFRIAPLFYLAIILYTFYDGMGTQYFAPNGIKWWYIPLTALFLHGWLPETINSVVPGGWSIAVEMTFYLITPFLFKKLIDIKSTLIYLFYSVVAATLLSRIAEYLLLPHYAYRLQYLVTSFTYFWFFSQLPVFILGILLYHLIKKYPLKDNKMALFLLCVSVFLFAAFLNSYTSVDLLPRHFLFGSAFVIFALSLHFSTRTPLVNGATIWIGRLSFSIYLAHFMVINILAMIMKNNGITLEGNGEFVLTFLLVLLLSTGASYIIHKLIEVPGINLGKKIINNLP